MGNNKEIKIYLTNWVKHHPDVWLKDENGTPHFWWVQNAVGDILAWPSWYSKFINKLEKEGKNVN